MHSHGLLLPVKVDEDELRQFIEAEGGLWQDRGSFSQGVFDEGPKAVLFVRGARRVEENLSTYTQEELNTAAKACGSAIVGHLTVDRSRGAEGAALAKRIIEKALERWKGYEIDGG